MNKPSYEIIRTDDGSDTVRLIESDVTFHSTHGAIQESNHVFIKNGLKALNQQELTIFEMGFGTGLNALLALQFAESSKRTIKYIAVESEPLPFSIISQINYPDKLGIDRTLFERMHRDSELDLRLTPNFNLARHLDDLVGFEHTNTYDLIFFDAFGPGHAPELWIEGSLSPLYNQLNQGGLLVTFCAQGAFKRALRALGFDVEAMPGPPGKREMTRAWKR